MVLLYSMNDPKNLVYHTDTHKGCGKVNMSNWLFLCVPGTLFCWVYIWLCVIV